MSYYIAIGDQHRGPFSRDQLLAQGLQRDSMVWMEGMPEWRRADSLADLAPLFAPPPVGQPAYGFPAGNPAAALPFEFRSVSSTKLTAGIIAIVLGHLGIHKFIIGATRAGVTMLLVSLLSCGIGGIVMWAIGIAEGIIYLTRSDQEFYETYIIQKKAWF